MQNKFSHIYFEKAVLDDAVCKRVIKKFPKASLIEIEDYRDLFNRKRQDWRAQKTSAKIILAHKKSEFLYPGSEVTPSFNHKNFYYNTLIMNCIYDCHYCYLQGMYPSANIVIFTNLQDYFDQTSAMLKEKGSIYLSISYDTDLLAFEHIVPYCGAWIEFAAQNKNLTVELRTKSVNYSLISHLKAIPNFILAWTLSPQSVVTKYETKTPSLSARLKAAKKAVAAGWRVRLCIDPILLIDNWELEYSNLISEIEKTLDTEKLHDVSLGTFRMNKDYYQNVREMRSDSALLHFPYTKTSNWVGYSPEEKSSALALLRSRLTDTFPSEKVFSL